MRHVVGATSPLVIKSKQFFYPIGCLDCYLGEETGLDEIYYYYRHIFANLLMGHNILYLFIFSCPIVFCGLNPKSV